jgi:hypothetical protein
VYLEKLIHSPGYRVADVLPAVHALVRLTLSLSLLIIDMSFEILYVDVFRKEDYEQKSVCNILQRLFQPRNFVITAQYLHS